MKEKLFRRYDSSVIDSIISQLKEYGYLNEENAINNYIRERLKYNLWGPFKIQRSLLSKGYKRDYVEKAIDSISNEEVLNYCKEALENYSAKQNTDIEKDKIYRFLYGRGFPHALIMESLRQKGYLQ